MLIDGKTAFTYRSDIHPNIFSVALQNTESNERFFYSIGDERNDTDSIAYIFGSKKSNDMIVLCGYENSEYDDIALNYIIEHRMETIKAFDIYYVVKEYLESKEHDDSKKQFFSLDLKNILFPEKQRLSFEQVAFCLYKDIKEYHHMYESLLYDNSLSLKKEASIICDILCMCEEKINIRISMYRKLKINALSVDDTLMGIRYITRMYLDKTGEKFDSFTSKRTNPQTLEVRKYCHICNEKPGQLMDFANEVISLSLSPTDSYNRIIPFNDIVLSAGSGGIRTIDAPKKFKKCTDDIIIHIDVSSMFPTTMANNDLFSRHLSEDFKELYKSIIQKRLLAKMDKNERASLFYKNALNAAIGLMNADWSYMYDPAMFMAIRIQAMLYTLGLLEKVNEIANMIIQVNVDGIFVAINNNQANELNDVVLEFASKHKLSIQQEVYFGMFQSTTNDYIAFKDHYGMNYIGKGLFSTEKLQRILRPKIVTEAVIMYFTHGVPVENTINHCSDSRKFLLSINVGSNFNITHGDENCGNSVRYYYSNNSMSPFLTRGKTIIDTNGGVEVVYHIDESEIERRVDRPKYYALAKKIIFNNEQQQTLF